MVVHVTIFGTAGEGHTIWREIYCVDGTEMAVNLCELLVEDNAKEFDFEATFGLVGHSDVSSVLTSSRDHVELLLFVIIEKGADSDASARLLTVLVLSYLFECFGVEELDVPVSRAGHEHGVVVRDVKLEDFVHVNSLLLNQLTAGCVDLDNSALVGGDEDRLVEGSPHAVSVLKVSGSWNSCDDFWRVSVFPALQAVRKVENSNV